MTAPRRVLVLYTTAQGQTRRIAQRFADKLRDYELEGDVRDLAALPERLSIGDWDGVAIGASVHGGHHLKAAAEFERHHRPQLDARPTAFFSVSLAAADEDAEAVAAAREYLDSFVEETGWQPTPCASRKGNGDVKWDQEYTDWDAVTAFADDFAPAVTQRGAHPAAGAA